MDRIARAAFVLMLFASPLLAADPALERAVEECLRELTGDDARGREAASAALVRLGTPAIPLLKARLDKTEDTALRRRIEGVLVQIQRAAPALELTIEPFKPVPFDPAAKLHLKIRIKNVSKRSVLFCQAQGELFERELLQLQPKVQEFDSRGGVKPLPSQTIDTGEGAILHLHVRDDKGKNLVPLGVVGSLVSNVREADFRKLQPGEEFAAELTVPVKALSLPGPGTYELTIAYRLQGDGLPNGISPDGKNKRLVDLLLTAYRCDLTAKVKVQFTPRAP
ncbi:MAG: hypothetical protein AB7K24_18405 [Gemmataceae bacterium]